jgi:dimethylhistidine N-methyltransferase
MSPKLALVPPAPLRAHPNQPADVSGHARRSGDGAPTGFAQDLLNALKNRPHEISPKYFYDAEGSRLFNRICELPEYYPTRTELSILTRHAQDMANLMEAGAELVEYGAGSLQKAGMLLRAMRKPQRFVPVDISGEHLIASAQTLRRALEIEQPQLRIAPLVADYTNAAQMARADWQNVLPRYGFFPGSSIGNFSREESLRFLRWAAQMLHGGALLLGTDLIKDPARLHAAYNDTQGVTAAFNRNLLARANRELDADFVLEAYAHSAFYNAPECRIEMHLVPTRRQRVRLCGQVFNLLEGESLHTENSYKFTIESTRALAAEAGFKPGPVWTDPERLFAVHWLQAPSGTSRQIP